LWHGFYKKYVSDPMMDKTQYVYNFERVEKAYHTKTSDDSRRYFAILHNGEIIGDIHLKHMNHEQKTAEFGVALTDDSVKGKGFGTEAIALLADYAFNTLCFKKMTASSVLCNFRSQHVLEKIGFKYTHEDAKFKYYKLVRHQPGNIKLMGTAD